MTSERARIELFWARDSSAELPDGYAAGGLDLPAVAELFGAAGFEQRGNQLQLAVRVVGEVCVAVRYHFVRNGVLYVERAAIRSEHFDFLGHAQLEVCRRPRSRRRSGLQESVYVRKGKREFAACQEN